MSPPDALEETFRARIEAGIQIRQALLGDLAACTAVARVLIAAYRAGHCLLLFGNGGSAADAQHIAAEFLGRFYLQRAPLRAHALTVNTSVLTAIANDDSFEQVFARQIEALGAPGDVAVGISTSGNAENVIAGLRAARRLGLTTVALTGSDGGRARTEADLWVAVPADDVARIQEVHITIGHIWSEVVEAALFGSAS